jgi:protein O-GlcNAc transferase
LHLIPFRTTDRRQRDCLWMGVPVVTLRGSTHGDEWAPRCSSGPAWAISRGFWDQEYVRTAVALAHDRGRLNSFRSGLRAHATASLGDGQRLAREIGEGYRWMWRQWCASHG